MTDDPDIVHQASARLRAALTRLRAIDENLTIAADDPLVIAAIAAAEAAIDALKAAIGEDSIAAMFDDDGWLDAEIERLIEEDKEDPGE